MKKALVLGTGSAQVDLICYLKEAGWWVIGCSYRREGKGLKFIDQFEQVNITDFDGIERLAASEQVDLVYSIGSDLAMPAVSNVAQRLGLPSFVMYETACLLQDKNALRNFLDANQLSPVKHRTIRSKTDLAGWDRFPAIVKPSDNQGQRGVFLAHSMQEVENGLENTLQLSRNGAAIIEDYLDGPEVSVNAFVVNGQVLFNEVSDRLVVEGYSGGIPKSHVLPSRVCTGDLLRETKELAEHCIHALGIQNGPVYFQLKLTPAGPRIIEITPRLDGCHMWRLIRTVTGVDLLDASVRLLSGDKSFDLTIKGDPSASHLNFFLCPPGEAFKQQDHSAPQDVSHVEYYYEDGETIRPINGSLEKAGFYIEREK